MYGISEQKYESRVKLGSFLVALLILSKNLLQLSSFVFGTTAIFKAVFVLLGVFAIARFRWAAYKKDLLIILVVLLYFMGTYFIKDNSMLFENFTYFLIYGLAGYAYSFCLIEEQYVIKSCMWIGTIWLAFYMFRNNFAITDSFSFGYLMLPLVISSFLLLVYQNQKFLVRVIHLVLFSVASVLILVNGSRGPIVCFVLFLMIYAFQFIKYSNKKIPILILFFSVFLILINYKTIIVGLHSMYPGQISFIEKSYLLINMDNGITNGRIDIVQSIFRDYNFGQLVPGIGIGMYESTHVVEGYTHNVFLSLLLDFGIVGVIFFLGIVGKFFSEIYKEKSNYLVFLFTVSIVHLMFSGTYWQLFEFWLFVFTFVKNRTRFNNIIFNNGV